MSELKRVGFLPVETRKQVRDQVSLMSELKHPRPQLGRIMMVRVRDQVSLMSELKRGSYCALLLTQQQG
ncbi:hypothetical protein HMPREF3044_08175 [Corynebacterium sp. HMSC073D01]|nr:hypothetical protein HMPREF3044_08175 [Corynebacterium sp. HMSC073D01]